MAKENKTKATENSVNAFINLVGDENKIDDSYTILQWMEKATGEKAVLWGPSIVGFGSCDYTTKSGYEGKMPLIAFSPRKNAITLYLEQNFSEKDVLLASLGKHKTSVACLYIKSLKDVDTTVLKKLIKASIHHTKNKIK